MGSRCLSIVFVEKEKIGDNHMPQCRKIIMEGGGCFMAEIVEKVVVLVEE